MQTRALILPGAPPLLKLMQAAAAESTVAATTGWHLFYSSRPLQHIEHKKADYSCPIGTARASPHLSKTEKRTAFNLIVGLNLCKR